jgi:hypothetical protein
VRINGEWFWMFLGGVGGGVGDLFLWGGGTPF